MTKVQIFINALNPNNTMSNGTTNKDRIKTIAITVIGVIASILAAVGVLSSDESSELQTNSSQLLEAIFLAVAAITNIIHMFTKSIH
jgi:hypothetical protein